MSATQELSESWFSLSDFVLVYLEGEKPPPPRHAEFRQQFLENLAKSQIEFEEVYDGLKTFAKNSDKI